MMKSNYIWLLDPGHGGMVDGKYVTAGKRSPVWNDGSQYFEGVGNREIVKKIVKKLRSAGIDARDIVNSEKDVPLRTRVRDANIIHSKNKGKVIYVSVHSDGFSAESAHGHSVYTSKGQTKSDIIAGIFLDNMELEFPKRKSRGAKGANLYVCRNTYCPAILMENFFMTNEEECKEILMTKEGQDRIVDAHIKSVLEIELTKPI
jgi:N-acetylmuramoyl-L-alanine amidase